MRLAEEAAKQAASWDVVVRLGRLSLFGAVLLGALSLGSAAEAQTTPPPRSISIMGRQFLPKKLVVPQGTTLTWYNLDTVRHTVQSPVILGDDTPPPIPIGPDLIARSGALPCSPAGAADCASRSVTFDTPGSFAFVCSIHQRMSGTIVVREPERTTPPPTQAPRPTPPPGQAADRRVSILGRQFSPRVLKIKQGDTVKWANGSEMTHTSTTVAPEGGTPRVPTWNHTLGPRSAIPVGGRLTTGNYTVSPAETFNVPGTFYYQCLIHPGMAGQINVAPVNPDA
jgi:plastocyanin